MPAGMCALTSGRFLGTRDGWQVGGTDGETSNSKVGPLSLVTTMAFRSCGYFSNIKKKQKKGRTKRRRTGRKANTKPNRPYSPRQSCSPDFVHSSKGPCTKPQESDWRQFLRSTSVWCVGQPLENCLVSAVVRGVSGNFSSCVRKAKISTGIPRGEIPEIDSDRPARYWFLTMTSRGTAASALDSSSMSLSV